MNNTKDTNKKNNKIKLSISDGKIIFKKNNRKLSYITSKENGDIQMVNCNNYNDNDNNSEIATKGYINETIINYIDDYLVTSLFDQINTQIHDKINDSIKSSGHIWSSEKINEEICVNTEKIEHIENYITKNNYSSIFDPQICDDEYIGYSVGSIWINTKSKKSFICVDNTLNKAKWKQTSNEIGEANDGVNLGNGYPIYLDKSGQHLRFKSIVPSNNIRITSTNEELKISSKSCYCFLLTLNKIDVFSENFESIGTLPWLKSEFGSYPNGKIIVYVEIDKTPLDIRVLDSNNAVLGIINNISLTGFFKFDVATSESDSLIFIETRIRGKLIDNTKSPRIISMILKYDN